VSIGMFSATVAVKYVSALSDNQKNGLMSSVKSTDGIILIADTVIDDDNKKNIG